MNIVYSTDNNYAPYCGISIISLLENNKEENINIYIIAYNISLESKISFQKIAEKYNVNIKTIDIGDEIIRQCPVPNSDGYFTQANFIRLFLTTILPELDKVIYLDCDIIVKQDLSKLWNTDITNYSLGAVIDIAAEHKRFEGYINSGVLLINLDYWRKNNIQQKFIEYIENGGVCDFVDQDVINYELKGTILYLSMKYNVQTPFYFRKSRYPDYQKEINKAIIDTAIIHYTYAVKPWNKESLHPKTNTFLHYMRMSEWKSMKLDWNHASNRKRKIRFYKRKFLISLGLKKSIYKNIR